MDEIPINVAGPSLVSFKSRPVCEYLKLKQFQIDYQWLFVTPISFVEVCVRATGDISAFAKRT